LDNNNLKHDHNYYKLRLTDAPDENDINENTHLAKRKKVYFSKIEKKNDFISSFFSD